MVDEKPTFVPGCSAGGGREACETSFIQLLARIQSEQRRRLALASGFRLLRSFGIDRLDAPALAAGRGSAAQMAEDFDDHRRIFDACPDRVEGAAMIFKALPQFWQRSMSMSKTRLSRRGQLIRGVSPWVGG